MALGVGQDGFDSGHGDLELFGDLRYHDAVIEVIEDGTDR